VKRKQKERVSFMKRGFVLLCLTVFVALSAFSITQKTGEDGMDIAYRIGDEATQTVYWQPGKTVFITAEPDERVEIRLPANATTGYEWVLDKGYHKRYVEFLKRGYEVANPELLGSSGTSVWLFKAGHEGVTELTLEYLRPWEEETEDKRVVLIQFRTKSDG